MVVLLFPVEEDFLADDDEEGVDELFLAELFSAEDEVEFDVLLLWEEEVDETDSFFEFVLLSDFLHFVWSLFNSYPSSHLSHISNSGHFLQWYIE